MVSRPTDLEEAVAFLAAIKQDPDEYRELSLSPKGWECNRDNAGEQGDDKPTPGGISVQTYINFHYSPTDQTITCTAWDEVADVFPGAEEDDIQWTAGEMFGEGSGKITNDISMVGMMNVATNALSALGWDESEPIGEGALAVASADDVEAPSPAKRTAVHDALLPLMKSGAV